jgi:hypothetical protein
MPLGKVIVETRGTRLPQYQFPQQPFQPYQAPKYREA